MRTKKALVFDGDCPVCRRTAGLLARLRLVPAEACRAYQSFEGETAKRLWDAGIRNEMAVLAEGGGEIRSGAAGLLWILSDGPARWLVRPLSRRPFLSGATWAYRLVSYNRRILSPPRETGITCACDPDPRPGYHVALVVLLLAFTAASAAAFGAALGPEVGAARALATAGAAFLPAAILGLLLLPGRRLLYVAHLAATIAAGAFLLLPAAGAALLVSGGALRMVAEAFLTGALVLMPVMQRKRTRWLGLRPLWLTVFLLSLLVGAAFFVTA